MAAPHRNLLCLLTCIAVFSLAAIANAAPPADSAIGQAPADQQRLLLSPMEADSGIHTGAWKMQRAATNPTGPDFEPKLGLAAVEFSGEAEISGAKGDFGVTDAVDGELKLVGMWVYLPEDANVQKVGFQIYDADSEALMWTCPADWSGWKWVELKTDSSEIVQAYKQADKNGQIDMPVRSVHVVWFSAEPGPSRLIVDELAAVVQASPAPARASVNVQQWYQPQQQPQAMVVVTNFSDAPATFNVDASLQRDSSLYPVAPPHPVHGSDHALYAKSWTEADGEVISRGSLTDGQVWTGAGTAHKKDHFTEAFQYIDLGKTRRITHMTWRSGDANHSWKVDVSASTDGETFTPVPSLQGVDHYKKWGLNTWPITEPFEARVIRFRYHKDGETTNVIRFPIAVSVYDGVADESTEFPDLGPVAGTGKATLTVPAHSYAVTPLPIATPLQQGAYLLITRTASGDKTQLNWTHLFCGPAHRDDLVNADSRFGMNCSNIALTDKLVDLGVGWVRFENMKWPFVSPEPGVYRYDGSVKPWGVNVDEFYKTYTEAGLNILSYMFLTPDYCSSAPKDNKNRKIWPPTDYSLYGEFCFQTVARYGSKKHPPEVLKTNDKLSGLGYVKYYEMWNEPNLNNPNWGAFAGSMSEYYELMRHGAEAVKRADPDAVVTSCGYAGMTSETVSGLVTHTYEDGKHPIDFIELLNVHYYSGLVPPEIATYDGNAGVGGKRTFVEELQELVEWRDKHKPSIPIWITETGYDSAGSFGTNERIQSARLPRVVMLCLANGIEKVFIYRERGSTPSKHAASGLLRNDNTRKPSWLTVGTMIRQLHGVTGGAVKLPHDDPNVYMMLWQRGGKPLLTVWTVDGGSKLGVDLGECTVVDAFGNERTQTLGPDAEVDIFPMYVTSIGNKGVVDALEAKSRQLQAAAEARRQELAKLRTFLFDIGSREHVGNLDLGTKRQFTPVLAEDTWDEQKGYGFSPEAALSNNDAHWIKDPLDRDSCKVRGGIGLKCKVEPGRYEVRVRYQPFQNTGTVLVKGGTGGEISIDVSKADPVGTADITVGNEPIWVGPAEHYGTLSWVTFIEKEEKVGK